MFVWNFEVANSAVNGEISNRPLDSSWNSHLEWTWIETSHLPDSPDEVPKIGSTLHFMTILKPLGTIVGEAKLFPDR